MLTTLLHLIAALGAIHIHVCPVDPTSV